MNRKEYIRKKMHGTRTKDQIIQETSRTVIMGLLFTLLITLFI